MATPPAASTDLGELRQQLKQLITQRESLEAQISESSERLNAPGQPGLTGSLLDKEVRQAGAAALPCLAGRAGRLVGPGGALASFLDRSIWCKAVPGSKARLAGP